MDLGMELMMIETHRNPDVALSDANNNRARLSWEKLYAP